VIETPQGYDVVKSLEAKFERHVALLREREAEFDPIHFQVEIGAYERLLDGMKADLREYEEKLSNGVGEQ
jgi:hypothetical protein